MLRRGWYGKTPSPCRHLTEPCGLPQTLRSCERKPSDYAPFRPARNRANIGFPANRCKSRRLSTSQIIGYSLIPPFVHYPQTLWKQHSTTVNMTPSEG